MTSPHVMIVEDSEPLSDAFRIVLEGSGFRVSVAGSLQAAALLPERADVLLLDLTLPDGDGLSLLSVLDSAGRSPGVSIALTGRDDRATRNRCTMAGCSEILAKPVDMRQLVSLIRALTGANRQPATSGPEESAV